MLSDQALRRVAIRLSVVAIVFGCASLAWAQAGPEPDMTVDSTTRNLIIDRALALLDEYYVFPDVARQMAESVRQRQKQGEYDAITSALAFRARLEDDLRAASKDKHLNISYRATATPEASETGGPTEKERERFQASLARQNFCFERVERLSGNVGYVDLRCFGPPEAIGETVSAAFTFLGHTDTLILDLRENGGGDRI